jgi:hypothetical protein
MLEGAVVVREELPRRIAQRSPASSVYSIQSFTIATAFIASAPARAGPRLGVGLAALVARRRSTFLRHGKLPGRRLFPVVARLSSALGLLAVREAMPADLAAVRFLEAIRDRRAPIA